MKRLFALILALCLFSGASTAALAGERLNVQGISQRTYDMDAFQKVDAQWYLNYTQAHPEVELKVNPKYPYKTTKSMMNALKTGKLNADVFTLWSHVHNTERFMDEGYCADLSGNAQLMAVLDQLYPPVAQAVTRGGKVYGMPVSLMPQDFLTYSPEAWALLGLTEAELPASFTGLLDFLEAWPRRFPQRAPVSLTAYWDADHCDNEHVYTQWLVGLLVRHYARQQEYLGQAVDFCTPEFLALLERCKAVGDALYGHDGLQDPYYLFCEMTGDPDGLIHTIPMRMDDSGPVFYAIEVTCLCVSTKGSRQAQAEALIASYLSTLLALGGGAAPSTEEAYDFSRARRQLFDLSTPDETGELTPEELALYRQRVDGFYFPMPGAFDSRAGGTNDIRLRFSRGTLSAEQYCKQLQGFVK